MADVYSWTISVEEEEQKKAIMKIDKASFPQEVKVGEQISGYIKIKNIGNKEDVAQVKVLKIDPVQHTETPIKVDTTDSIPAGSSLRIDIILNPINTPGEYHFCIKVWAKNDETEPQCTSGTQFKIVVR